MLFYPCCKYIQDVLTLYHEALLNCTILHCVLFGLYQEDSRSKQRHLKRLHLNRNISANVMENSDIVCDALMIHDMNRIPHCW